VFCAFSTLILLEALVFDPLLLLRIWEDLYASVWGHSITMKLYHFVPKVYVSQLSNHKQQIWSSTIFQLSNHKKRILSSNILFWHKNDTHRELSPKMGQTGVTSQTNRFVTTVCRDKIGVLWGLWAIEGARRANFLFTKWD